MQTGREGFISTDTKGRRRRLTRTSDAPALSLYTEFTLQAIKRSEYQGEEYIRRIAAEARLALEYWGNWKKALPATHFLTRIYETVSPGSVQQQEAGTHLVNLLRTHLPPLQGDTYYWKSKIQPLVDDTQTAPAVGKVITSWTRSQPYEGRHGYFSRTTNAIQWLFTMGMVTQHQEVQSAMITSLATLIKGDFPPHEELYSEQTLRAQQSDWAQDYTFGLWCITRLVTLGGNELMPVAVEGLGTHRATTWYMQDTPEAEHMRSLLNDTLSALE